MKLCVCGSRSIDYLTTDQLWGFVEQATQEVPELLIHGGAPGVDEIAGEAAMKRGIPVKLMLPQWRTFGRYAGLMRNIAMAQEADLIVAVWDGRSRGSKSMIDYCRREGIPVHVFDPPPRG